MATNLDLGSANLTIGADGSVAHRVLADLEAQLESLPPTLQLGSKEAQNFRMNLENLATGTETAVAKSLKSLAMLTQRSAEGGGVFTVAAQDAEEFQEFVRSATTELERMNQVQNEAVTAEHALQRAREIGAREAEEDIRRQIQLQEQLVQARENAAKQMPAQKIEQWPFAPEAIDVIDSARREEEKILAIEKKINDEHQERILHLRTEEELVADIASVLRTTGSSRGGSALPGGMRNYWSQTTRLPDFQVAEAQLNSYIMQLRGSVRETLNARQATALLNVELQGMARNSGRAGTALSAFRGRSNKAAVAVTQLGFAAEDFLVVFETMGVGGGLRAAGNNLSFLASTLNPMAGVIVGIGTALGAMLIPKLFEASDAAKELAEHFQALEDFRFQTSLDIDIPEVPLAIESTPEQLVQSGKDIDKQIEQNKKKLKQARDEFELLLREASPLSSAETIQRMMGGFDIAVARRDPKFVEFLEAIEQTGQPNMPVLRNPFLKGVAEFGGWTDFDKMIGPGFADKEVSKEFTDISKEAIKAAAALDQLGQERETLDTQIGLSENIVEPFRKFTEYVSVDAKRALKQFNDEWDRAGKAQEKVRRETEKEMKRVKQITEKEMKRVGQIIDNARTPLEKFIDSYNELDNFRQRGLIDEDVFKASVENIEEEFQRLTQDETKDIKINFAGIQGIEAGSAEAFARIQGAFDANALARTPVLERDPIAEMGAAARRLEPVEAAKPTEKNTDAVLDLNNTIRTLTNVITERGGTLANEVISGLFGDAN